MGNCASSEGSEPHDAEKGNPLAPTRSRKSNRRPVQTSTPLTKSKSGKRSFAGVLTDKDISNGSEPTGDTSLAEPHAQRFGREAKDPAAEMRAIEQRILKNYPYAKMLLERQSKSKQDKDESTTPIRRDSKSKEATTSEKKKKKIRPPPDADQIEPTNLEAVFLLGSVPCPLNVPPSNGVSDINDRIERGDTAPPVTSEGVELVPPVFDGSATASQLSNSHLLKIAIDAFGSE